MSDERDPIEELFRTSADDREYPFRESDWKDMEARLDYNMPRPGHNLSGQLLIALLILSTPWWPWTVELPESGYPAQEIHEVVPPGHQTANPEPERINQGSADKSGDRADPAVDGDVGSSPALSVGSPAGTDGKPDVRATGTSNATNPADSENNAGTDSQVRQATETSGHAESDTKAAEHLAQKRAALTALVLRPKNVQPLNLTHDFSVDYRQSTLTTEFPAGVEDPVTAMKTEKSGMRFRPYILMGTELGGTDLNRRPSFGGRAGIGLRYMPVPQASLDVAVLYSQVNYTAFGDEYKMPWEPQPAPYPSTLQWTDGLCEMIEIPVEIRWHATSWFNLGTGLRSYVVLREQYELHFTDYYGDGYKVPYEWKEPYTAWAPHLVFSAGLVIPAGRYNVEIQPFYQMPLKGIGQGSVEWKSAGVSVLILF